MTRGIWRCSVSMLALGTGLGLAHPASSQTRAKTPEPSSVVEEVIVTATKREERLQDVPLSVRAVTGQDLERLNAQDMSGYVNTVPGVSFENKGPSATTAPTSPRPTRNRATLNSSISAASRSCADRKGRSTARALSAGP